jgi:hypothetical protein
MATFSTRPLVALLLGAVAATLGGPAACASRPPAAASSQAPQAAAPLAALAGERVVLVPAQRIHEVGTLGWTAAAGEPRAYLANLDDEIGAALAERGVGRNWVMPKDVVRSARRNPTYATDPFALAVAPLEAGRRAPPRDAPLSEPLASELRAIVALGDARYVILPVEMRFERLSGAGADTTAGRAVLRVALVDARASQVRWLGEVSSDPAPAFSPSLAAGVASRLADLVAPR